jgi:plastocyanin
MRIIACALVIALGAGLLPASGQPVTPPPIDGGETITVHLSSFAFDPPRLRLKAWVPVRLRLINDSSGGHDFSAPGFFAASNLLPGAPPPPQGSVAVGAHQTVEIVVIPRAPGTYYLECTHFLHSFFGMHGTIEVTP